MGSELPACSAYSFSIIVMMAIWGGEQGKARIQEYHVGEAECVLAGEAGVVSEALDVPDVGDEVCGGVLDGEPDKHGYEVVGARPLVFLGDALDKGSQALELLHGRLEMRRPGKGVDRVAVSFGGLLDGEIRVAAEGGKVEGAQCVHLFSKEAVLDGVVRVRGLEEQGVRLCKDVLFDRVHGPVELLL